METQGDGTLESQPSDHPEMRDDTYAIRLVWPQSQDTPIVFANHFLSQIVDDTFIVTFGQLVPPALLGTDQERREQALHFKTLEIAPLARFILSPQHMRDCIRVFQENLNRYEARIGGVPADE